MYRVAVDGRLFAVAAGPPGEGEKIWISELENPWLRPLGPVDEIWCGFPYLSHDSQYVVAYFAM